MGGRHIPHPSYYFRPSSLKGLPALRPYRPRGKEAASASFPLGGGLVWRSLQTRLSFELGLSQFIPRWTLHQMSEGGHWDTDMCVDLACCFDTLEHYYYMLLFIIIIIIIQTMLGTPCRFGSFTQHMHTNSPGSIALPWQ